MAKILLVDDEPFILRAFARVLDGPDLTVDTATDGESAMAKIRTNSYDVIVSDVAMPGMNGFGLLRAARAHDRDVPFVLVSGQPSLETSRQAVEYGAFQFLQKPVAMDLLLDVVRRAAQCRALARSKREARTRAAAVKK